MEIKIKIGILLDSYILENWEYEVIKSIINSDFCKLEVVVLNTPAKENFWVKVKQKFPVLLNVIYRRLDYKIFKVKPDAFEKKNIYTDLKDTETIIINPIRKKYTDTFDLEATEKIKARKLDVLVRFGFRILKGDILKCAKFGIWSYHHGDNDINRGTPPCFWEVANIEGYTGAILQILSEDLDAGNVLYKTKSGVNKYSVNKTRNNSYWKSSLFMIRVLSMIKDGRFEELFHKYNTDEPFIYRHPLYKEAGNLYMLQFIYKIISRLFSRVVNNIFFIDQWIISYYFENKSSDNSFLKKSLWRFKKIIPLKKSLWMADPFVFYKDGKYFIFFEEMQLKRKSKGHISVIELKENGEYSESVKVLERPYHLSYPFLFDFEGEIYMIPETSQNRTIEVYRNTKFPDKWVLEKIIIDDIEAVDSTICFYNNRWWLFCNSRNHPGVDKNEELSIFYADNPFGVWKPHKLNPVISDITNSRPAGNILFYQNNLYRVAQDSSVRYGYGMKINKITLLEVDQYKEELIEIIHPLWDQHVYGTHTFNQVGKLTVIDNFIKRPRFW